MTLPAIPDYAQRALDAINAHQRNGAFHPYTCGNAEHDWRQDDPQTTLVAEWRIGADLWLVCPCGYEQRLTAWDGMLIAEARQWPLQRVELPEADDV